MITDMEKRNYKLKKRAESQEVTRARIVDALMQLHEEVGPRSTTISAIAERAGVQRLTVYRHFPSEEALFNACTSQWLELNPPPDPRTWSGIDNPRARCECAIGAIYAYYAATHRMWAVSLRDEAEVPALKAPMNAFRAYLSGMANDLLAMFAPVDARQWTIAVTIGHILHYTTWASLREQGLDERGAVALAMAWLDGLTADCTASKLDGDQAYG